MINTLTLKRFDIFGELYFNNAFYWHTIENQNTLIPCGEYWLHLYESPRAGMTVWQIIEEPQRHRQIHIANTVIKKNGDYALTGCIGIGTARGELWGMDAVLNSRIAFEDLMDKTTFIQGEKTYPRKATRLIIV